MSKIKKNGIFKTINVEKFSDNWLLLEFQNIPMNEGESHAIRITHLYDDDGDQIETKISNIEGISGFIIPEIHRHKYIHKDNMGNWTERITYKSDGSIYRKTIRKYEYY